MLYRKARLKGVPFALTSEETNERPKLVISHANIAKTDSMQLAVPVLLVVFMMPINVCHDDVRHNVITILLYDIEFHESQQGFYFTTLSIKPKRINVPT